MRIFPKLTVRRQIGDHDSLHQIAGYDEKDVYTDKAAGEPGDTKMVA
ncbi:hypothetical protein IVA79_10545 [Bradyrhizobium sp. 138]|nr:hypothetical protein [Bradyrhizobium sp. 138]MCK1734378.1 hypothetical protein [Bradyrhizobium sp. 138]